MTFQTRAFEQLSIIKQQRKFFLALESVQQQTSGFPSWKYSEPFINGIRRVEIIHTRTVAKHLLDRALAGEEAKRLNRFNFKFNYIIIPSIDHRRLIDIREYNIFELVNEKTLIFGESCWHLIVDKVARKLLV